MTPTPDEICELLERGPTNVEVQKIGHAIARAKATIERDIPGFVAHECEASPFALATAAVQAIWPMFAPEAADLIQQQRAEIERLSAALDGAEKTLHDVRERVADAGSITINDVGVCWLVPDAMMLAIRKCIGPRAALGKDASDVRAREEDRG